MDKRNRQNTSRSRPHLRKGWLLWAYAFVLGALPAVAVAVNTGKFGFLPILVAVITWVGCLIIWFIAERLI